MHKCGPHALYCLLLLATAQAAPPSVVVIANRNVPVSIELARYYMNGRDIPEAQLCVLDLPTGEQMSRHQYNKKLRDPLLAFLREREWIDQERRSPNEVAFHESPWITTESRLAYLVSMYGVPLRIADTRIRLAARVMDRLGQAGRKNVAAVDSELALLLAAPYDIAGPVANPLHRSLNGFRQIHSNSYLVVATRLDGPDPAAVQGMIDGALFGEHYGLQGCLYFDARGLETGPYHIGDYWIREAHARFERAGFETVLDLREPLWPDTYPMEHAALYFGWYAEHVEGPFLRDDFQFQPGAIACHIHSTSALSLKRTGRFWAAPLLHKGAAATMGAVSEPFLTYTPDLSIFAERLLAGHNFGEAAYMSQSVLSWQITFIGDPLYRPFRHTLAGQLEHLAEAGRPELDWAQLRWVNTQIRQGRFLPTMNFLQEQIEARDSLVLREKRADLYARNDRFAEAGREYGEVMVKTRSVATAARVAAQWIRILRALDLNQQADELVKQAVRDWDRHPLMMRLEGETTDVD
jgi:uncharacterized protein (TIGR03790 family)